MPNSPDRRRRTAGQTVVAGLASMVAMAAAGAVSPIGAPGAVATAVALAGLSGEQRAQILKEARRRLGLTQDEAARAAGLSRRTWQNIESGGHDRVATGTMRDAAAALGLPDTITIPATHDPGADADRVDRLTARLRSLTPDQLGVIEAMVDQMHPASDYVTS